MEFTAQEVAVLVVLTEALRKSQVLLSSGKLLGQLRQFELRCYRTGEIDPEQHAHAFNLFAKLPGCSHDVLVALVTGKVAWRKIGHQRYWMEPGTGPSTTAGSDK